MDPNDRLVEIKTKFDPTNLFRLNHNIGPTGGARSNGTAVAPMSHWGPGCVKTSKNRPNYDFDLFVEISVLMKSIS